MIQGYRDSTSHTKGQDAPFGHAPLTPGRKTITLYADILMHTPPATDIIGTMDALSDVNRGRLLLLLEEQELTVSELQAVLQQPQSTVSRHLKILGTAGWVVSRVAGTSRWYSVDPDHLDQTAARLWHTVREEFRGLPAAAHDRHRLRSILQARRSTSKAFFSSSAGQWDALRREMFGANAQLTGLLGLLDDDWVVGDLGCGTGQVAAGLAPFVQRVISVDDSPEMLAAARDRLADYPNVEIRRGELEELPVEDRQLDVAILFLVLHHIVEPARVIAQAHRALKPGGRLLIVDMMPHDREEYRVDMGHAWMGFSGDVLAGWMAGACLEPRGYRPLPADPEATGPALFVATAVRPATLVELDGNSIDHATSPPPAGSTSS